MHLTKLFEMQRVLDERIEKEHPRVCGEDRLTKKILALQVELGELANEWRGFKFWSNDQKARVQGKLIKRGLNIFDNGKRLQIYPPIYENPLLEEYVDCLHFILSIGLDLGYEDIDIYKFEIHQKEETITDSFLSTIEATSDLDMSRYSDYSYSFSRFFELGELLGFTWEQIENAYISKNEINHTRQSEGY